jgi:hypothetical protein
MQTNGHDCVPIKLYSQMGSELDLVHRLQFVNICFRTLLDSAICIFPLNIPRYLSPFCTAITEYYRLGNLEWIEIYWLIALEAWKSKIKGPASGEGHLAAASYGGRAKRE